MFELEKNSRTLIVSSFDGDNFPPKLNDNKPHKREMLVLTPNSYFPKTKLKYKKVSRRKSRWYNSFFPASAEMWSQNEGDDKMQHFRLKFSHYVHFEQCLDHYQILPVEIPFRDRTSQRHKYKPLALLTFSRDLIFNSMKPVLVDVRSKANIRENWDWFYPAWRAAKNFAHQNGWNFCLIRDEFFDTPLYRNAEFLLCYRSETIINEEYFERLMKEMHQINRTTIHQLLKRASCSSAEYNAMMPQLWQLIDSNYIFFNIKQPLTMNTGISL